MSHDPKYDVPEFTVQRWAQRQTISPEHMRRLIDDRPYNVTLAFDICDECAEPIDADDLAPSCGVHRLHLHCFMHFSCRWCDEEWKEANA